jgi:hypothetical protein
MVMRGFMWPPEMGPEPYINRVSVMLFVMEMRREGKTGPEAKALLENVISCRLGKNRFMKLT